MKWKSIRSKYKSPLWLVTAPVPLEKIMHTPSAYSGTVPLDWQKLTPIDAQVWAGLMPWSCFNLKLYLLLCINDLIIIYCLIVVGMTSRDWRRLNVFWRKPLCCRCGCQTTSRESEGPGRWVETETRLRLWAILELFTLYKEIHSDFHLLWSDYDTLYIGVCRVSLLTLGPLLIRNDEFRGYLALAIHGSRQTSAHGVILPSDNGMNHFLDRHLLSITLGTIVLILHSLVLCLKITSLGKFFEPSHP